MNEIERAALVLESVIGRKKSELARAKCSFQSQLNFMEKKDMPESLLEKLLNNACHWESEIERLTEEIDILSHVDEFGNFIPESWRQEETIYEVWHNGRVELHNDPYPYG